MTWRTSSSDRATPATARVAASSAATARRDALRSRRTRRSSTAGASSATVTTAPEDGDPCHYVGPVGRAEDVPMPDVHPVRHIPHASSISPRALRCRWRAASAGGAGRRAPATTVVPARRAAWRRWPPEAQLRRRGATSAPSARRRTTMNRASGRPAASATRCDHDAEARRPWSPVPRRRVAAGAGIRQPAARAAGSTATPRSSS